MWTILVGLIARVMTELFCVCERERERVKIGTHVDSRGVLIFRGCYMYVQSSMELGPEDVSLLERCPHFQRVLCTVFNGVGT